MVFERSEYDFLIFSTIQSQAFFSVLTSIGLRIDRICAQLSSVSTQEAYLFFLCVEITKMEPKIGLIYLRLKVETTLGLSSCFGFIYRPWFFSKEAGVMR